MVQQEGGDAWRWRTSRNLIHQVLQALPPLPTTPELPRSSRKALKVKPKVKVDLFIAPPAFHVRLHQGLLPAGYVEPPGGGDRKLSSRLDVSKLVKVEGP